MGEVSETEHVLWLDPGRVTGWAVVNLVTGAFETGQEEFYETGLLVSRWAHNYEAGLVLGWEDYLGHGGSPKWALEVIGVARWFGECYGCRLQTAPASSRVVVTLPVLKALGAHALGKEHANDAARHLVAWLRREGLMRERLDEVFTSLLS